jgi:glycerol kinase
MRTPLVLAIDQGTTNSKALLVDAAARVVAQGTQPLAPISTPRPGWFEQDPQDLWQATLAAVAQCLAGGQASDVVAVALTNQRESVVAWQRQTGQPVSPVLGWQDARTDQLCRGLAHAAPLVHSRTGLTLDPMFSAPKLRWLLDTLDPGRNDICLGTIDAYLIARLTGQCLTEAGNASRTLLLNLATLDWDDELLTVFGIPRSMLPAVQASDHRFGTTRAVGPIPAGWPVVAVLADSHAALFGHGLARPGLGKVTYGTGSSVMAPLPGLANRPRAVSTTLAWLTDSPCYAREGNIIATGAALEALAGMLGLADVAGLLDLADTVDDPDIQYVPAFSGLGAPHWDRAATGLLVGLGRDTSPAQLARAGVEAVAHQVCDVLDAFAQAGDPLAGIVADGGLSVRPSAMQAQADLAGIPVRVAGLAEASALGVAKLAWQTLGAAPPRADWQGSGEAIGTGQPDGAAGGASAGTGQPAWGQARPTPSDRVFTPRRPAAWRAERRDRWRQAVQRSRGVAVTERSR